MSGFRSAHSHKVNSSQQVEVDLAAQSLGVVNIDLEQINGQDLDIGQQLAAASIPVVVASDQSAVSVTRDKGSNATVASIAETGMYAYNGSAYQRVTMQTGGQLDTNLTSVGGSSIDFGQEAMTSSIPVVIASDQSAVSVSSTNAAASGSHGNMEDNQSVASGDTSTVIDVSTASDICIFGSGTSLTDPIEVEVSEDNTNFFPINSQIYPNSGNGFLQLSGIAFNRIRLKFTGSATAVTFTCQFR